MDPNSAHQRWSLWQYRVYPTRVPSYPQVKHHCARFGRLVFGSASQMRIVSGTDGAARPYWEVSVRSEGHPVHDPTYAEWMHAQWRAFLQAGFGAASVVQAHARLEAGDRQDGRPADQLIILPELRLEGSL